MKQSRLQARLPAVLRLARVISEASAAGSYEPQMMPAHQAARIAARISRLHASGLAKTAEPVELRKWLGAALNTASIASTALPLLAETKTGRRVARWAGKKVTAGYRAITGGGTKRARQGLRATRAAGNYVSANRAGLAGAAGGIGGYQAGRDMERERQRRRAQETGGTG